MQLQLSEAIDIVVVAAALPLIIVTSRRLHGTGRRWLIAGYLAILGANTLTIAEGVGGTAREWMNLVEHFMLLAAGVGFCVWAWQIRRSSIETAGRAR